MLRQCIRLALRLRCIIHRARHRLDLSCQLRIRLLQLRSKLMSCLRITHQVSTTCLRVRQILTHLRNGISIILQTSVDQSVLHLLHLSCDLTSLLICSLRCINRSRIALSSMRLLISSLRLLQLRQHLLQLRCLLRMILLQLLDLSLRVRNRLVESLIIHLLSVAHLLNHLTDLSYSLRILS